jgi:hypothetical protein
LLAESFALETQRSSFVSLTVRMAEIAQRMLGRTPARPAVDYQDGDGLVGKALRGLDRCCRLIPSHQGVVDAERILLRLQRLVETRFQRHQRFQQLRETMNLDSFSCHRCSLRLNPISQWIRAAGTREARQEQFLSGSVLYFLYCEEVYGLRMNLEGQVLINELADYQPCTVAQWARLTSLASEEQLERLVRQLAEMGLVAWDCE